MSEALSDAIVLPFKEALEQHAVYQAVSDIQDLRLFMQHHIYSVWDFMSLIKTLQREVAPTRVPWVPGPDRDVVRFINELVLEEESDQAPPGPNGEDAFASHFELYLGAMREIGADTGPILAFHEIMHAEGIDRALETADIPEPARRFTRTTFDFIASGQTHRVAAALALGREHIIPCMFRALLGRIGVDKQQAPIFHFYLERHIHLDEDFHAPLSLKLLRLLCGDDEQKVAEAVEAAQMAVDARIHFWDGVAQAIEFGREAHKSA